MKYTVVLFSIFFVCINLFFNSIVKADSFDFIAGVNYQKFNISNDYEDFGVSSKFRYLRYRSGTSIKHGFVYTADFPGISFVIFNLSAGYGFKSTGSIFWEASLSYSYSAIFGTGLQYMLGFGFKIGPKWHVSFPAVLSTTMGLSIIPMFGYNF